MIATASPKAIRRFRVMNWRLSTARSRCPRARRPRRARCEKRAGRETMMAALYPQIRLDSLPARPPQPRLRLPGWAAKGLAFRRRAV